MELAIANNTTTTTTKRTASQLTTSSNKSNNTSNQSNPRNQSNSLSHRLAVSNGDGDVDVDGTRSPFQREVREWQRVDPTTGALLTGRLEADRWINGPLNSYGKISDSQNIAQPNGTRLSQRKQLEVLQQRTASGAAVQVIRTQTVQSSSSRWSSSSSPSTTISPGSTTKSKAKFSNNNTNSLSNGSFYNKKNNNDNILNTSSRLQPLAPIILDSSPAATATKYNIFNNNHNIKYYNNDVDDNNDDDVCVVVTDLPTSNGSDYEKCLITDRRNYLNQESPKQHDKITSNNNEVTSTNIITSNNNNHNKNISGNTTTISSNLSNFLLLDTAPSLKLSNLMKSSSSISSNSNSSYAAGAADAATTTTAATTAPTTTTTSAASATNMHTFSLNNNNIHNSNYKSEAKTNLHSVGNTAAATLSTSTSSASMTVTPTNTFWQQRKQQQEPQQQQQQTNPRNSHLYDHQRHPTFDKINSTSCGNFAKSRVGGSSSHNVVDNDDGDGDDDDDDNDVAEFGGRTGFLNATDERSTQVTPTHLHRQQRRDLESFRLRNENHDDDHYNYNGDDYDHRDDNNDTNHFCDDNDVAADADANAAVDLRFSPLHQRHPLIPNSSPSVLNLSLERGRSISTDDLSTEWDSNVENKELDEPSEWRRVSKLRRSFQSTATTTKEKTNEASQTTTTPRRPLDLPKDTVSVSKIRAQLENGRRLTTAMRNNHVDLAALHSILDTPTYPKPSPVRRTTFLTAESLKEIRGKLKKLSDESLYKEDFMAHQLPPTKLKQIGVRDVKTNLPPQRQLTPERSVALNTTTRSAFTVVSPQKLSTVDYNSTQQPHTTNSLESRQKCRDTTSAEWHLRRKSYGFEKMSPPANNSMFRMDASTDSGLGRSGELTTWSPTETVPPSTRGTIVHFGDTVRIMPSGGLMQRRAHQQTLNSTLDVELAEETPKRHSIAVDDSQYVRKTSQVHLNGLGNHSPDSSSHQQLTRYDTDSPPNVLNTQQQYQRTQHKRVEFCKTEVHFAAESGRVNIVETDGKPPPTNNFRRRRRTSSGPLQSLVKSASLDTAAATTLSSTSSVAIPITRFGDDTRECTITTSTPVAHKASLMDNSELMEMPVGVTVSLTKGVNETYTTGSRSSYASTTSGIDTTDNENDEIAGIRGILKNKPIKPKPYHLGENFDSSDSLWGLRLKTGGRSSPTGLPSLRGEVIRSSPELDASPSLALNKTVAERIRSVEKLQDSTLSNQTNSYSTKINLNLSETTSEWKERGSHPRQASAQELMLNELKEHQKILDEGLKSTSLIIRTMRSASEFDEAMRRLSIASMEGAIISPSVVPDPTLKSNSYQETSLVHRRYSHTPEMNEPPVEANRVKSLLSSMETTRRLSTGSCSLFKTPMIAPPRLKLIGNAAIPVSKQLSQLRRLYDAAAKQDDELGDSADEEVKRYFVRDQPENSDSGGGTLESSSLEDEHTFEYSTSWSRLKAKHTVWQIEAAHERELNISHKDSTPINITELPKSNVMNIELHSPQQTPLAKPRLFAPAQQHNDTSSKGEAKEPLRIIKEARGARKLREHELSYFGVPVTKVEPTTIKLATSNYKRTLPNRSRLRDEAPKSPTNNERNETQHQKWRRNDSLPEFRNRSPTPVEPQLINGSAHIKSTERRSSRAQESKAIKKSFDSVKRVLYSDEEEDDAEPFYENITNEISSVIKVMPPQRTENLREQRTDMQAYNRKRDLKRDERILSEMTLNADQTMKALSDEATLKDQHRRSITRRNSKPLETINEKSTTEKMNDAGVSVKFSRGTVASEAKRHNGLRMSPSPTTMGRRARTSSQSSVESYSRERSRSLSSEREYENIKEKSATATKHMRHTKPCTRSSSLESQRSTQPQGGSSGDEHHRREERLRVKTKRIPSSGGLTKAQQQERTRHVKEIERRERDVRSPRVSTAHKEKSASTIRSSQGERIECAADTTTSPQRSSSSRRYKSDPDKRSSSSRLSAVDKPEIRSSSRLVSSARPSHDHDSAQRLSKRSDRSGTEKEKLSRSKGRTSMHSSDHNHQHHHQHPSSSAPKVRHTPSNEVKKSSNAINTAVDTSQTHSKNAHSLNGISMSRRHHEEQPSHQQQQRQQHMHSLTTSVTGKHCNRLAKERK